MLRNLDIIYYIARSSKNFSTKINFSENIFLVYRVISLDLLTRLKEVCEEVDDDIFRRTSKSLAVYNNSNAMRTHPYANPQHNIKIVKHLIYI